MLKLNKKTISKIFLLAGFIAFNVGAYFLIDYLYTTTNVPEPSVNANMMVNVPPHSASNGPYSPSKSIVCSSKQQNKLDDCDSDNTPDFGENWVGYVKSQ